MSIRDWFAGPRAPYEFQALATYNAEVARGIVHTTEWQQEMAEEQRRFRLLRAATAHQAGR